MLDVEHPSTPVLDHWFGSLRDQAVEDHQGYHMREFATRWKRWSAVRVERSENAGYWIGAMGTREPRLP